MPLIGNGSKASQEPLCADEEQLKVDELRSGLGSLAGCALKFCSDACLVRYLKARNWHVKKSKKMLEETLKWRASFKPEKIRWDDVAEEGETGKVYRAEFVDKTGRTVLVLVPANQNTSSSGGQMKHLFYLMENAILNLPPDQEQMVWLIDFKGWSLTTAVPIKTAHETINILQSHYPERLGLAILYNPPKIFEAFWKIARHFLDRKTSEKVKFVYSNNTDSLKVMEEYFDVEKLYVTFGGRNSSTYNHEEHSKRMQQDDIKALTFWGSDEDS